MSEAIDKIVEQIKGLTLLEASELVKKLEETLGVSAAAAAPVVVAAAGAGAAGGPAGGEEAGGGSLSDHLGAAPAVPTPPPHRRPGNTPKSGGQKLKPPHPKRLSQAKLLSSALQSLSRPRHTSGLNASKGLARK